MRAKRKLWATQFRFAGALLRRHESKAAAYRYIQNDLRNWLVGGLRTHHLTVFVDERDGQGYQVYERIDLAELAKGDAS